MNYRQDLHDLFEASIKAAGFELWGVEYIAQGKHSILRVYIDSERGITLDDCAAASEQISAILDVEDPIPGHYNLEVSSPGLDRPLYFPDQFERVVGKKISIASSVALGGRKKFSGTLQLVNDEKLTIAFDEQAFELPLVDIIKANVVAVI